MTEISNNSIKGLIGEERVRTRPASMLGSDGLDGARHGFTEIYGNALDEVSSGYGDRLDVHYYTDGSISVRDYGRGVPLGWNDNESVQNWNWHAIYNELYQGGKYDNNQEKLRTQDWSKFNAKDYAYLFSVGLNGLGAASTQYTSEFFKVRSYVNGKMTSRDFEKGRPIVNGERVNMFALTPDEIKLIPEIIEDTDEPNGTFVHWKPDIEVFDDVNIGSNWLFETCKYISDVAGIELHFIDDNTNQDIVIEAGNLEHLVTDISKDALVLDEDGNPFVFSASNFTHGNTKVENKDFIYVCTCDVALALTDSLIEPLCFHNSVLMKSGVQYNAINDAVQTFLKDKTKGLGIKIDIRDIDDFFGVVVSSYSNHASFRGQTKDGVDDYFIYATIKEAILTKLNMEYGKGTQEIVNLVHRVIQKVQEKQALADYAKVLSQNKKIMREKEPLKFVSCDDYEDKDYSRTELWITEGDSAKGSVKAARNKKFQAIYPIRGKSLNVLKKSLDKILKNKEIREIFSLLGTGMDISAKDQERLFDISKLKFDKIIFATDADEDGYQIRVLLFLIFYKLAPELITSGHVYIAETPRFRVNFTDGTYVYAKNDEEMETIRTKEGGRIRNIARYKGLGEVNADILRETTVHPDTRNLIPVTCDFGSKMEHDLIDALFGNDKFGLRKQIISDALNYDVSDLLTDDSLQLKNDFVGDFESDYDEDDEDDDTEEM